MFLFDYLIAYKMQLILSKIYSTTNNAQVTTIRSGSGLYPYRIVSLPVFGK